MPLQITQQEPRPQSLIHLHTNPNKPNIKRPTNGRKRQRSDECSNQDNDPAEEPTWQYPPEFWDRLSKVPLEYSALEELERRTWTRPSCPLPPTELAQDRTPAATRDLARFARRGGPDLRHLRGYPPATSSHQHAGAMSSSSQSQATKKLMTPYNPGFEQHLIDHEVHPTWRSRKPDLENIRAALAVPRRSLSPSKISDGTFENFQNSYARCKDKYDVEAHVFATIIDTRRTDLAYAINKVFGNLEPLTDGTLAPANPNIYYGSYPEELDLSIRDELASHIIPTADDRPIAPNFFMEVKGPDGSLAVAMRQARYDGAIGSRAMHSLQNYNKEEPSYDGKPYTFSTIYHGGTLQLYAHHVTRTTPEGRPEYHMSQVKGYAMTSDRETFISGVTAFRNARDLAKQYRDRFIQEANARASQARITTAQATATKPHEDEILTSHELVDPAHHIALQAANGKLQQHIAEASCYDLEDAGEAPAVPAVSHHLYTEDNSQEASQEPAASNDNPSMSFVSSFPSGFSANPSHSKRSRQSLSPRSESSGSPASKSRTRLSTARRTVESTSAPRSESSGSPASKSRTRPSTTRRTVESTSAAGSVQLSPSHIHWVKTYGCEGKVYFRNLKGFEVKTEPKDWTRQIGDGFEIFYWKDSESGQIFWATELP